MLFYAPVVFSVVYMFMWYFQSCICSVALQCFVGTRAAFAAFAGPPRVSGLL